VFCFSGACYRGRPRLIRPVSCSSHSSPSDNEWCRVFLFSPPIATAVLVCPALCRGTSSVLFNPYFCLELSFVVILLVFLRGGGNCYLYLSEKHGSSTDRPRPSLLGAVPSPTPLGPVNPVGHFSWQFRCVFLVSPVGKVWPF